MKKILRCTDCGGAAVWKRGRGTSTQTHRLAFCTLCRVWKWIPRE
ncbi:MULTISPECIES: hypothetical protein [Bacillus cereus group]